MRLARRDVRDERGEEIVVHEVGQEGGLVRTADNGKSQTNGVSPNNFYH